MRVELEIPDSRFREGQVVWLQNDHNDKGIFLLIVERYAVGRWQLNNGKAIATVNYSATGYTDNYACIVQDGSVYDCEDGGQMDTGTVLVLGRAEIDANAMEVIFEGSLYTLGDHRAKAHI